MDKKKICVVSAYAYIEQHINYGSLFQYYALEKALDQLNCEAYWLRFVLPKEKTQTGIKAAVKRIAFRKRNHEIAKVLEEFQKFILKYLRVSDKLYTEEDLQSECPEADAYITGSDQVWGGTLKPNYLCFADDERLKISYAASFGKSVIAQEHKEKITPWIQRMNAISVREPSGVQICKEMGKDAVLVLDPTLLLDAECYPADNKTAMNLGKYYFAYFLNVTKNNVGEYVEVLNDVKKKLGIFLVAGGVSEIDRFISREDTVFCSPESWLGMYRKANGIITNTFHGTVFAIIFKKSFLVCFQNGSTAEQNERIYSLLKLFKLEDRAYARNNSIEEQMNRPIDWNCVDTICKSNRETSFAFLKEALEENRK